MSTGDDQLDDRIKAIQQVTSGKGTLLHSYPLSLTLTLDGELHVVFAVEDTGYSSSDPVPTRTWAITGDESLMEMWCSAYPFAFIQPLLEGGIYFPAYGLFWRAMDVNGSLEFWGLLHYYEHPLIKAMEQAINTAYQRGVFKLNTDTL